jgi:hypothetical protein
MEYLRKILFIALLTCAAVHSASAGNIESYIQTLSGNLKQGDSCRVSDDKFKNLAAAEWSQIQHLRVDNLITFEIRFDTSINFYNKPFNCTLNVTIEYFTTQGQSQPNRIENIPLQVQFDTVRGKGYKGIATYRFNGAHDVKVIVNSISCPEYGSNIPAIFRLKNQIFVERKYPFSAAGTGGLSLSLPETSSSSGSEPLMMAATSLINPGTDGQQVRFSWNSTEFPGSEWVDIEWTFVDALSAEAAQLSPYISQGQNIPTNILEQIFTNNSTRVTLLNSAGPHEYIFNYVFPDGHILARARGAQLVGTDQVRHTTPWNYTNDLGATLILNFALQDAHEPLLNWQHTVTYAEEGMRKEAVSYMDGELRVRQAVSLNNTDNKAIVQETIFDIMGRATISVLPAPTDDFMLHYYPNFNRNAAGQPYSFKDIDEANCVMTVDPMGNTEGAEKYFSDQNPFISDPFTKYIPKAEGFPFSTTEYMPDNTGRIRKQSGVGPTFRMGAGRETSYFYGKPDQEELDRLFGSEAGLRSHYQKTMVIDPNGQTSVSYINASGKTIATALAGPKPDNVEAISSYASAAVPFTRKLIDPKDIEKNTTDLSLKGHSTFLATAMGPYVFNFSLDPGRFEVLHGNNNELKICSDCYYDVIVTVQNNCGPLVPPVEITVPGGMVFNTDCNTPPAPINGTCTLNIDNASKLGEYYVSYKLRISKPALEFFDQFHIDNNTSLDKLEDFFREDLKSMDFSGCFSDCKSCETSLGTLAEFTAKFEALLGEYDIDMDQDYIDYITDLHGDLLASCSALPCSPCSEGLELLKADVMPDGQYARYDPVTFDLLEPSINVLQHYNTTTFHDENGQPEMVTDADGESVAPNNLPLDQFIKQYIEHPYWANDLVVHHPEYCYYQFCVANSASFTFDRKIREMTKASQATTHVPNLFTSDIHALVDADPFFNGGSGSSLKGAMETDLTNYSEVARLTQNNVIKNVRQTINWMMYCRQTSNWSSCSVDPQCVAPDREWELYRDIYLELKQKYYEQLRNNQGCNNCHIGQSAAPVIGTPCTPGGGGGAEQFCANATYLGEGLPGQSPCGTNGYMVRFTYTGANPIPPNISIKVIYQLQLQSGVIIDHVFIDNVTGVGFNCYNDPTLTNAQFIAVDQSECTVVGPGCPGPAGYENKIRIYSDFMDESVLDGIACQTPGSLAAAAETAQRNDCKENCEAMAESWVDRLRYARDNHPDFSNITDANINDIRTGLIAVCQKGCDVLTPVPPDGVSVLPPGTTVNGYNKFEDVFTSVLGANATMYRQKGFAAELLSYPYPYNRQPVRINPIIYESSQDICDRITTLQTQWQGSGVPVFHDYLAQLLGSDYKLTAAELADLQQSCSCNFILDNPITLPIAFTKAQAGNPDQYFIDCADASTIMADFNIKFSQLPVDNFNYETIFTNYFNHRLGYNLRFTDYQKFLNVTCPSATALLYNQPIFNDLDVEDNACMADIFATAMTRANIRYKEYIEEVRRKFRNDYLAKCMAADPELTVTAEVYEYHYTLYYYDQSSNLVKTIPPEGVDLLSAAEVKQVNDARAINNSTCPEMNIPEDKPGTLSQLGLALNSIASRSVEMWLYSATPANGHQVIAVTPGHDYMYHTCISGGRVTVEVYSIDEPSAGVFEINLTNSASADITGMWPLPKWVHVVAQGTGMANNPLVLYLNGQPLTLLPDNNPPNATICEWEIDSGNPGDLPENLSTVKHLRIYNRLMLPTEIANNYSNGCFAPSETNYVWWGRFNIPAPGSETTIGPGSTTEANDLRVFPAHRLPTLYTYNSLNNLTKQVSPDGGTIKYWYDKAGRNIIKHNETQGDYHTYLSYDDKGRMVETGEKNQMPDNDVTSFASFAATVWARNGGGQQSTRTTYDVEAMNPPGLLTNLHNRVSVIETFDNTVGFSNRRATYYSYDLNGNVKTLYQIDEPLLSKRIDYEYDLVSNKVNIIKYQAGQGDQFFYKYMYDADNRPISVQTSRDGGTTWMTEAEFNYYLQGPLARLELGDITRKVQGMDYAYTLQGWSKGVNSNYIQSGIDMGQDGSSPAAAAKDVIAYSLYYHPNDYAPIDNTRLAFNQQYVPTGTAPLNLYNGNIAAMTLSNKQLWNGLPTGRMFNYDQLHRLTKFRVLPSISGSPWPGAFTDPQEYTMSLSYDGNGNILSMQRKGRNINGSTDMDNLTYRYPRDPVTNHLLGNQLTHINDAVPAGTDYDSDIEDQQDGNYQYDQMGNLTEDQQSGISEVKWNLYGKVKEIVKVDGSHTYYFYDPAGRRVRKSEQNGTDTWHTYYVRDATGNVLAVYKQLQSEGNVFANPVWKEQHIYGGGRIGMWIPEIEMTEGLQPPGPGSNQYTIGDHRYELTDHLGNVISVISDKVIGVDVGSNGSIDYYDAEILSASDYYAFGMLMPGKTWNDANYRYGFNGQEKSDDISGAGNHTTAEYWEYDTRIGRRWNIDLVSKPDFSGYAVLGNNPMAMVDPNGADWYLKKGKGGGDGFEWFPGSGRRKGYWHMKTGEWSKKDKAGFRYYFGNGPNELYMYGPNVELAAVTVTAKFGKFRTWKWFGGVTFVVNHDLGANAWTYGQIKDGKMKLEDAMKNKSFAEDFNNSLADLQRLDQAQRDYRKMQIGSLLIMSSPLLIVGAAETGLGYYLIPRLGFSPGAGVADVINQRYFQGDKVTPWTEINWFSTATNTFLGGGSLFTGAIWGASGNLFDGSVQGFQSGTWYKITDENFTQFKADFVGNMAGGYFPMFLKGVIKEAGPLNSSVAKTTWNAVFHTFEGTSEFMGEMISNKIQGGKK